MSDHPLESLIRASVAAVMNVTGESRTDVGKGIGLAKTLVSRRQRGELAWKVADLGRLADHWQIQPCALLSGPTDTLADLDLNRVNQIRTVKGLPPLSTVPVLSDSSTAASAVLSAA